MTKLFLSTDFSVIAFYGFHTDAVAEAKFYSGLVSWCGLNGRPPDRIAVKGEGFSGKITGFARPNSRLQKTGFQGVSHFSLFSIESDVAPPVVPVQDSDVQACFTWEKYGFIQTKSSVVDLSSDAMLAVAGIAVDCLRPDYGIGYRRDRRLGPGYYAVGITQGLESSTPEYDEPLAIGRWGNIGMRRHVYRDGLLRDVYPLNFLTAPQLSAKVGVNSLEDWIRQDRGRGQLSEIGLGTLLWTLTEGEIALVRPILWDAGRIFDWKKFL